jgi:hypothetical protein
LTYEEQGLHGPGWLYDKDVSPKDIVLKGAVPAPPAAQELLSTLNSKTPKGKTAD